MTSESAGSPPAEVPGDVGAHLSLHTALRRVIVTNADPDTAAHRVRGVLARWLRERNTRALRDAGLPVNVRSLVAMSVVQAAEELEAGTASAAEADAEIARLRERQAMIDGAVKDAAISQFGGVVGVITDDVLAKRLPEIEAAVRRSERERLVAWLRNRALKYGSAECYSEASVVAELTRELEAGTVPAENTEGGR